MKKKNLVSLLDAYFRNHLNVYSIEDVQVFLSKNGIKISEDEAYAYIMGHPMNVPLKGDVFITRAALFTGLPFSIKPTKFEVDNNILIVGHRFVPFVEPEILPSEIVVRFIGNKLKKKSIRVTYADVASMHQLLGEEYFPQYVANDPANADLNLAANDYLVPNEFNLTVIDCELLYKTFNFKYGDRIQALVADWDKSVIEISPYIIEKENPFVETGEDKRRNKWFSHAETALLKIFSNYGACNSIDQQLLFLYLENRKELSIKESGSIEELLNWSKKIGFVDYGVETRLWRKDEEIPISSAFLGGIDIDDSNYLETKKGDVRIAWYIIDAFLLDSLAKNDYQPKKIYDIVIPKDYDATESEQNAIILQFNKKRDKLIKKYNCFADYQIIPVRSRVLALYERLVDLAFEFDSIEITDSDFIDSQQLVMFSQLVQHTKQMLMICAQTEPVSIDEIECMQSSIEGMELSFEDIADFLKQEIKRLKLSKFSIIKSEE